MNISSIGSSYSVQNTQGISGSDDTSVQGSCEADNASSPAATANLSKGAQMMQKLKDLQQSDPTKFKQVLSGMAQSLRADAQGSSATGGADMLSKMADKLDAVAQSGDLSQLAPSAPPSGAAGAAAGAYQAHGHHRHHGGGGGGGGGKAGSAIEQAFDNAIQSTAQSTAQSATSMFDTSSTS